MEEELSKLDQPDLAQANRHVARWQAVLSKMRNAELLGELVDYHLRTGSQGALKVLLSLKDLHTPDFFAKLHESLTTQRTRLAALKLLAHVLNGQASWLYKLIESPVFTALLNLLRSCTDLVVLTSAAFVMCAVLPLTPFYVSRHLADLCEVFTRLATLKSTEKSNEFPQELLLCLNVAVYYLFLQLYSMFPCQFVNYLRGRFGPTGEVQNYQEYIAPLFRHVQLHPNLITTLADQELKRTQWSSLEPHDVATLSLSVCMDLLLVPGCDHAPFEELWGLQPELVKSSSLLASEDHRPIVKETLSSLREGDQFSGKLSSEQMNNVWSPTIMFGSVASAEGSRSTSLQGNLQRSISSMSSPSMSEPSTSANSSLHGTPLPSRMVAGGHQALSNYSPTASLEAERSGPASLLPTADLQESPAALPLTVPGKNSPEKQPGPPGPPRKGGHLKERLSSVFQWWGMGLGSSGQMYREPIRPPSLSPVAAATSRPREPGNFPYEKVPVETRPVSEPEGRSFSRRGRPLSLTIDLPPMESSDGDALASPILSIASSSGSESTRNTLSASLPIAMETPTVTHVSPGLSLLQNPPASCPMHKFADATVLLAQAKLQQMAVRERLNSETLLAKDLVGGGDSPPLPLRRPRPPLLSSLSVDSVDTLEASVSAGSRGNGLVTVSHTVFPAKREQYTKNLGRGIHLVPLSPVGILDQFIHSGALLHHGNARDIPVTDLEGVDWSHFGSCPHSEELGIMTAHVAMLHSQLLFERYQCQQHARRSRRLLSQARTAKKMESEIISLSAQIHHQEATIQSLRMQLVKQQAVLEAQQQSQLRADFQAVQAKNRTLSEAIKSQENHIATLQASQKKMAEELKMSHERIFKLESERHRLRPQLSEGARLRAELDALMQEHLVVEELYHQQQLSLSVLRRGSTESQQANQLSAALQQKNEALKAEVGVLRKEVAVLRAQLQESGTGREKWEGQIAHLERLCRLAQDKSREKIESIEKKYHTVKAINLKLEAMLLESRGMPYRRTKGHDSAVHKRSSSSSILSLPPSLSRLAPLSVVGTTATS